jgi:hypothetical protein
MEPDDEAAARKGVGSYNRQSAPRDAEAAPAPSFVYARRYTARSATFPQPGGRHRHDGDLAIAPGPSFVAWVDGAALVSASASLDQALSEYGGGALPEFVGAGGGEGVFRVPLRAAVHPGRPPALEVRPHPLRETQVGSFLRTLACDPRGRQLWAGTESGVRVCPLDDAFGGCAAGAARRGDEEAAPFRESVPEPPALCVAVDAANRLVWTGHRDGVIRAWRMDQAAAAAPGDGAPMFDEAFAWQAFSRTPVLSIVITSYGENLSFLDHFE